MIIASEVSDNVALRGLVDVMSLLHSARDRDGVLRAVVAGVCEVLGYGMSVIRVLDEDKDVLRTAAVVGPADAVAAMSGRSLPLAELAAEFALADRDDDVYFVPCERLPQDAVSTWVPDIPVETRRDAWHPMDALYVALNDPGGNLLGVLGVDLPLTGTRPGPRQRQLLQLLARQAALAIDRTRMLDQQRCLVASLQQRQQESSALVATLTHDLKGPLTVIRGHAELARDDVLAQDDCSARVVSHLDGIDQAVKRMASTINELLDQREPATSVTPIDTTGGVVDVADLVGEIVTVSRVVADRRGLTLELDVRGEAHVRGNRRQLSRAVDNLLANALKYTSAEGRVVMRVDHRAGEVVVTCADDGVGIPVGEQEAVFADYTRAAHAKAAGIEGTGLGLSSARRIVEAHGGTLTLTSSPGVGSTFTARLPGLADPGPAAG